MPFGVQPKRAAISAVSLSGVLPPRKPSRFESHRIRERVPGSPAAAERLSIRCAKFTADAFKQEVANAARCEHADHAQVEYLISYLEHPEAGAKTLVVEYPYVDRHYLEEYSGYYATSLRPPSAKAARLHLFATAFDDDGLDRLIERAAEDYEAGVAELQEGYLGYVVVRPLPSAPVGRTVLRPYAPSDKRRCFEPAATKHHVHLLGLTLTVAGLPFQQQEQAVGACATTAIWSALARVTRADGARAVTPLAVTAAATGVSAPGRTPDSRSGLDLQQTVRAIRHFGYMPYVPKILPGAEARAKLQMLIKCYVRSGIPVMLRLQEQDGPLHMVTISGYRESDEYLSAPDIKIPVGRLHLRSCGLSRIYVHDDRFGPYARMVFDKAPKKSLPVVKLSPYRPGFEEFEQPYRIWEAVVPLYPKLRLNSNDLLNFAVELLPLMREVAGSSYRDQLRVDLFFMLGGRYLKERYLSGADPVRTRQFVQTAVLSRYVGVVRFLIGNEWFVDAICDSTDIERDRPRWAALLAMVANSPNHVPALASWAEDYCPTAVVL